MKTIHSLLVAAVLALGAQAARATTVVPPSFDQLVAQAETIFQGKVTDVRSQWTGEGAQRHIVTYVTFQVEDAVKGAAGQTVTLRMFGGTVDGESMGISDAPEFKVGDDDIVFVENNGSQLIPLVGIMHGRFHVKRDNAGRDIVTNHEGQPVRNVAGMGRATNALTANTAEASLTADAFKAAVREKLKAAQ